MLPKHRHNPSKNETMSPEFYFFSTKYVRNAATNYAMPRKTIQWFPKPCNAFQTPPQHFEKPYKATYNYFYFHWKMLKEYILHALKLVIIIIQ